MQPDNDSGPDVLYREHALGLVVEPIAAEDEDLAGVSRLLFGTDLDSEID